MISDEYRQKLYDGLAKKKGRPSPESSWWSDAYEEMVYDEEFILNSEEWPDRLNNLQLFGVNEQPFIKLKTKSCGRKNCPTAATCNTSSRRRFGKR